jgi:small GTP-binding protein
MESKRFLFLWVLKIWMARHRAPDGKSKRASKRMRAKICLIGEPAVGKTSLIRRYVLDEFDDEYIATMGAKVTKKEVEISDERVGNLTVSLLIWDIMGDKGFRELYKEAFFHGAQGIIAVCDVTKRETLSGLRSWIGLVSKVAGSVPTHFLGNKVDLKEGIAITESDVKRISDSYESSYLLTSAKTGMNVEKAFVEVARRVAQRRAARSRDKKKAALRPGS